MPRQVMKVSIYLGTPSPYMTEAPLAQEDDKCLSQRTSPVFSLLHLVVLQFSNPQPSGRIAELTEGPLMGTNGCRPHLFP